MQAIRLLVATIMLVALSGCISLPKNRSDLKTLKPRQVRTEYRATLGTVMASYLEAAEKCSKEWRRWAISSFDWASAPVYKMESDFATNGTSAALEVWGTHPMAPNYLLQLFELRELSESATEVVHYRLPADKKPATTLGTHTETWYPPGNPNCW